MKRTAVLLPAFLLMCSLCACGNQEREKNGSNPVSVTEAPGTVESTEPFKTENSGKLPESPETQRVQEPEEVSEGSNILIVYFSRYGNTEYPDDVDATTSASIVADGTARYGTTEYAANMIWQTVGGDIHRIETVTPYTEDFNELRDVNHEEMNRNFLPELKESSLDIASYDTEAGNIMEAWISIRKIWKADGLLPTFPYLKLLTAGKT